MPKSDDHPKCAQCGKPLNPVAVMLGPVCGACVRRNHQAVALNRVTSMDPDGTVYHHAPAD